MHIVESIVTVEPRNSDTIITPKIVDKIKPGADVVAGQNRKIGVRIANVVRR